MGEDLAGVQAFFAPRAAAWDRRFFEDGPAYRQAVAELAPPQGGIALDAGCGTGRALASLRVAVGPVGTVLGLDATPEMLTVARRRGRRAWASLVLGDAWRLPIPDGVVDAVLAAGLLPHLDDPVRGLAELARVARRHGRLGIFHPISRTALARRRGQTPTDNDAIAPVRLVPALDQSGWETLLVDDGEDRFLVLAERR